MTDDGFCRPRDGRLSPGTFRGGQAADARLVGDTGGTRRCRLAAGEPVGENAGEGCAGAEGAGDVSVACRCRHL